MLLLKPPYNILYFINILLSPNFYTFSDMEQFLYPYPIFSAFLNFNFLTKRTPKFKVPEILPGTLSQTHLNQKSPKDPKLILILTMKQVLYTYFWKTLPVGDLIWLTPISLAFYKSSQIGPSSSNHLKSATQKQNLTKSFLRVTHCCVLFKRAVINVCNKRDVGNTNDGHSNENFCQCSWRQ